MKTKIKEKVRIPPGQKDEKTKKKKKLDTDKVAGQLMVINRDLPPPKKADIRSYFGKQAPTILNMLEMNNTDGAMTLLKKRLLQTTISLVPYAESMVRHSESQRGIYQYTTLVSQVREIIADIQADQDRSYIAQQLIDTVLRPAFMELAQVIIADHYEFRRSMEKDVLPERTQQFNNKLQSLAKGLAQKMQNVYKDVEAQIHKNLQG